MIRNQIVFRFFVAMFALGAVVTAHADDGAMKDPMKDPEIQATLRAMNDASTWYHPDLFGEYAGVRRYAHGNYQGALKYFKIGAYYADKFSQLCIGLMYLNGTGVHKDAETAYAWLDLAAERGYPQFVATRDGLKAQLTPEQLERAEATRDKLAKTYADAVAKPRMAKQLRMGRAQMTGSRTGFDFGVQHTAIKENCGNGKAIAGVPVPVAGCGGSGVYARYRWEPKEYFAARDAQWKATVSVGALSDVGAAGSAAGDKSKKPDKPKNQP